MKKLGYFLFLSALFIGCSGLSYRWYGLEATSYEGTLLGPKAKDDLPFKVCAPTVQSKSPCIVMLQDEYFRMYQELLAARQALKDCQKPQSIAQ